MKRLQLILLSLALLLGICLPLCVKVAASDAGTRRFVIDNAKLLTQNQAEQLERSAEEISRCQHCDVVILTADGIDGRNPTSYADDYFDRNDYGQGSDRSGILLLLELSEGVRSISTCGFCIDVFPDSEIEALWSRCSAEIQNGRYAEGLQIYLQSVDRMLSNYDASGNRKPNPVRSSVFALGIGLLLGFAPVSALKSQLKSVRSNYSATDYVRAESMHLDVKRDSFLYSNTSYRVLESQRSAPSSGSSTHVSSSGVTHGGGSAKF